jgi:hypothetical protein
VDPDFGRSVFVNCPFDPEYDPILKAILFCLVRFGLRPRIATERSNAGETRIEKIAELIAASRFSIHDLSRCEARAGGEHYRMNMPFELGMDFACRRFGGPPYETKVILVLEEQPFRYQAAISDLAGIDIEHHRADYAQAVRKVRNWLAGVGGFASVGAAVGASRILAEYEDFQEWYTERQIAAGFSTEDMRDVGIAEFLQGLHDWTSAGAPRE